MITRRTIVVDTSVLYLWPQPWEATEFQEWDNADYVIPATVLSELDMLAQRPETRAAAKAALKVITRFIDSGATAEPVSCGRGSTFRVATNDEETSQPGLTMDYADDRILALSVKLKNDGLDVTLATTEIALYAKAAAWGIGRQIIATPEPRSSSKAIQKREKELFWEAWKKVDSAGSPIEMCQRAYQFLRLAVVLRTLAAAAKGGRSEQALLVYEKFERLRRAGGANVDLSIIGAVLGLGFPPKVNLSTAFVIEYADNLSVPRSRSETAPERTLRLQREQAALNEYETRVVETMRGDMQTIRDYLVGQLGDDIA